MSIHINGNAKTGVDKVNKKKKTDQAEGNYTVKSGDTIYGLMKAFNFKDENEIRTYIKVSGTAHLKKGQKIKLPTARLETTVAAVAKKYNMTPQELLALNPQIKDASKLPKGTLLYVPVRPFQDDKPASESSQRESVSEPVKDPAPRQPKSAPQEESKDKQASTRSQSSVRVEKPRTAGANENSVIASALKKAGGAIEWNSLKGKDFQNAFSKITTSNVADVIKAYDKISPKESLVEMICSEITSNEKRRKSVVMSLYDRLAQSVGESVAPPEVRAAFEAVLDKEFDKIFGFVSTKELDKIINSLVEGKYPDWIPRKQAPGNTKVIINGQDSGFTVDELYEDWQKNAKSWNRTVMRPRPCVDKNGNVIASVQVFEPTGEGELSGCTIIVNPGHGGVMAGGENSPNFDPGTSNAHIVTKKVNGRTVELEHKSRFYGNGGKALEEWALNQTFAKDLTEKLTSQGAKVVYISGSAHVAPAAIKQYRKDADMVVSLHANSSKDHEGVVIIPTTSKTSHGAIPDEDDAEFAQIIQENLESNSRFSGRTSIRPQPLAVLRDQNKQAYEGADILIETGNLKNASDVAKLTNSAYRDAMINEIDKSIIQYLNQPKKKKLSMDDVKKSFNRKYVSIKENPPYEVKPGDNLSAIAQKFGVQVRSLKEFNRLNSDKLSAGQVLKIPYTVTAKNVKSLSDVSEATGLSSQYIKDLKRWEDSADLGINEFHTKAYKDKNGNWTIGVGHLIKQNERDKYIDEELSKEEVCTLLAQDILDRAENLKIILGADVYNNLPQPLKDAVMDFTFSRGESTIENHPGFVKALKSGDYAKAVSLMNIDYSYVTDEKGKKHKRYLTGMAKRRLSEIHHACKIFGRKIPDNVKKTIQTLYDNGLKYMNEEFPDANERANIKAGFNKEVEAWFGDLITLK